MESPGVDHVGSRVRDLRAGGVDRQARRQARVALRTSSFACQLAAAGAGLSVGLFPRPFVRAKGLREVRVSASLAAATLASPTTDVWLASHRVLRDVPRVAVVWTFLADELRSVLAR